MLNVFYGRENLDKIKFIYDNIGSRGLVMVPDQYTLEAEREAFRHLGISSLMDVEVVSPSALGGYIVEELGGSRRTFINKYGRHMLLYRSALRCRDDLQVFRGMETKSSFLDEVNNFISEMKQYNCGPRELEDMASRWSGDSYTHKKLSDICLLYDDYEKQIDGKYTDSEDYIDLYLQRVRESRLIKDNHIWVYGFDSFAPKTMALLGKLMESAAQVNVVLTWDEGGRDDELFELTGLVIKRLEEEAAGAGIAYRRYAIPDEYMDTDKAPIMRHIERELYSTPCRKAPTGAASTEGVTLVEAAGLYNEAESAAAYVTELVQKEGLRYKDIRLICNDPDRRSAIIERVFEEYGIELFTDAKKDLAGNQMVQAIISLIDVMIVKYNTEALLGFLKSGFAGLSEGETARLENYAIKYKIKGNLWKRSFKRGISEYGEDGLREVEELRRRAVEPLAPLEKVFKAKKTGEFIRGFYDFLCEDMRLKEKVLQFIGEQEKKEIYRNADEMAQVWESLSDVLNQIYEIMGEDDFDPEIFRDIFTVGMSYVEIGVLPPTEDGLIMGNIQRSRSGRVKALLVLGANEGVLPQEKPAQGIFSSEERQLFADAGRELCKVDSVRFMEEKLALYRNFAAPSQKLWMSYSLSDEDGNQLRPSRIFLKIRQMFPTIEVQRDVLNRNSTAALASSNISGLRHLCRALEEVGDGRDMDDGWRQALRWMTKNMPDKVEIIRKSIAFTNRQEELGRAAAQALFKRRTDEALTLSPSRLEKFARCPFSHLVAYGLRPEERRVFEAAPREIGDIYHRCLMELTEALNRPGKAATDPDSPWLTITRDECDRLVEKEIRQIEESYREGLFRAGNEESYRSERITRVCKEVCWSAVQQVRSGTVLEIKPEIFFGRKGDLPPIELTMDGQKVYIEGIIDRVDYMPGDRVKIIDYKTGNESFDIGEAQAGYRLQLMMYLQAACGTTKKPAGVFYFRIKEPMEDFSGKEADMDMLQKEIRKSFKLDGVMIDEPQVVEAIAGAFSGYSEIVPVKATKEGIKNTGKEGLLTEEEFENLREQVGQRVHEACKALLDGCIDVYPMKTKDRSACTYCRYKGICRFDTVFDGCKYNVIS